MGRGCGGRHACYAGEDTSAVLGHVSSARVMYLTNKDTRKNFHTGANTHIHTQLSTDRYSPPLLSNALTVTKVIGISDASGWR